MKLLKFDRDWKRLNANSILKPGDRPLYAGMEMGASVIPTNEIGLTVRQAGYLGAVRKRKL